MKKTAILLFIMASYSFAHQLSTPEITVLADGLTDYENIHYEIARSSFTSGTGIKLITIIDNSAGPKYVDVWIQNSNNETIAVCEVKGVLKDNKTRYRIELDEKHLEHSYLWIITEQKGQFFLKLNQFKSENQANNRAIDAHD